MSQQTVENVVHCRQCGTALENPKPGQKTVVCPCCGATYVVHGSQAGWLRRQWELMQYRNRNKKPKAEEAKTEEVKAEEVKAEEVKVEEVKTEEVKAGETKPGETKVIKRRSPRRKKGLYMAVGLLILAGAAAAVLGLNMGKIDRQWQKILTADQLPPPPFPIEKIVTNEADYLGIYFSPVEKGEMMDYLHACEAMGYRRECLTGKVWPVLFSDRGWRMEISYLESMQRLHLKLEAPLPMEDLDWPSSDLPRPYCEYSHSGFNSARGFHLHVSPMDHDQWSQYVDQVMALGYVYEMNRYGNSFSASKKDGTSVDIDYLGNRTVEIRQRQPK